MPHDKHIREKAIYLRTEKHMTLDEIIERLSLPRTTVYRWIKDIPLGKPRRKLQLPQTPGQVAGTQRMQARYALLREQAYQQGWETAPELLKDITFRDFVVLYMAEGTKRQRNSVAFVNSDARMVKLAAYWMRRLANPENKFEYRLQYHADHDFEALKQYWAEVVDVHPDDIKFLRKSNSNQLSGRQFRSVYGLLTVRVGDTYLRARLQAWMDFIKAQW
jgi:AcrR family transcriptional regulator